MQPVSIPAVFRRSCLSALLVGMAFAAPVTLSGQFAGQGPRDSFIDTSVLQPAPGTAVSILVFEDLGCPACAHAHPYEVSVAEKEHVPLLRHDYPLPAHIWTFDAAVFARYLQDKVSPATAAAYRTDVFASQRMIGSKDDLQQYNARWAQQHGVRVATSLDPTGTLAAQVRADTALGERLHVTLTPTIVVVTPTHYQVVAGTVSGPNDPALLDAVVKGALAQSAHTATAR